MCAKSSPSAASTRSSRSRPTRPPPSRRYGEAISMLSFPEEIVLLLLDETKGEFVPLPESVFAIVMSGAALMDLALRNRIDTDREKLMVGDRTPLGDDILDDVLSGLAGI